MSLLSGVKQKCCQQNPLCAVKSGQSTCRWRSTSGEVEPNLLSGEYKQGHTRIYNHTHSSSISLVSSWTHLQNIWTLELQFIYTATSSRTLGQVVNKGHSFVLTTDKRKTMDFFVFHLPHHKVQPPCWVLQKLVWTGDSSKAWERLYN